MHTALETSALSALHSTKTLTSPQVERCVCIHVFSSERHKSKPVFLSLYVDEKTARVSMMGQLQARDVRERDKAQKRQCVCVCVYNGKEEQEQLTLFNMISENEWAKKDN